MSIGLGRNGPHCRRLLVVVAGGASHVALRAAREARRGINRVLSF